MQIFFLKKERDTEKRRAKKRIILSDTYMQITYSAAPFFAPFLCAAVIPRCRLCIHRKADTFS